jgi:hypothetical protein
MKSQCLVIKHIKLAKKAKDVILLLINAMIYAKKAMDCTVGDTAYNECLNEGSCNFPDDACNKICEQNGCDEAADCSLEVAFFR